MRSKKQRTLREAIDETVDPGKLDAEEVQNEADEAWAVMVAGLASGQTSQERKTLEDFDDLVGTPYYWEAVVRAGMMSEAECANELSLERERALSVTLAEKHKEATVVCGDGSDALYAILQGCGVKIAPTSLDEKKINSWGMLECVIW